MIRKLVASCAVLAMTTLGAAHGAAAQSDDLDVVLLHGIPGFDADVVVDGSVVIESFSPGDIADLQAFAGQTLENVEVRSSGGGDVAIGPIPEFGVPSSGAWTVVAHLDTDAMPVITPFENDPAPTSAGQGRLTVRHVAAAPAADVLSGDSAVVEGIENGSSTHLTLPSGSISGLQVALAGSDQLVDVPSLELDEGVNLIVYVVGSLDDETLDFYVQEREVGVDESAVADEPAADVDNTPAPTQVNTGGALTPDRSATLLLSLLGVALLAVGSVVMATSRGTATR